MLSIRRDQMDALEQVAKDRFVDEMWLHCKEFAPKICEVATEKNVRNVIRDGIDRAALVGFTNRGPVRFYLELMFSFGCEFASDPQHSWVTDAFRQIDTRSQASRAEMLFENYTQFAQQTIGVNNEILVRALTSFVRADPDNVVSPSGETRLELLNAVAWMWPERFTFVGQKGIERAIESAITCAQEIGATSASSMAVAAALGILVGHGFARDPLYPWIGRVLNSASEDKDPDQLFKMLHSRGGIYMSEVIKYWSQN